MVDMQFFGGNRNNDAHIDWEVTTAQDPFRTNTIWTHVDPTEIKLGTLVDTEFNTNAFTTFANGGVEYARIIEGNKLLIGGTTEQNAKISINLLTGETQLLIDCDMHDIAKDFWKVVNELGKKNVGTSQSICASLFLLPPKNCISTIIPYPFSN